MDIRKKIVVAAVLLVIGASVWADTGNQTDEGVNDRDDRIESRLDRKGDRIVFLNQ